MAAKLTRRHLASLAVLAQAPVAPAQAPADDDITIQRENIKRWREQLAQAKLPIATEPAVVFKA